MASTWVPDADLNYDAKLGVIRSYAGGYSWLVETGLWDGWGSGMRLEWSKDRYVALDVSAANVTEALRKGYYAVLGDSGENLPDVLEELTEPALFWLDAHLVSEVNEPNHSPLIREMEAIIAWPHHATSTLLIDDVRMMGRDGWPTVEQVLEVGRAVWDYELRDDIVRFTPCG